MKKIFAIFTALCIVVLIFGSCFSSWNGEPGEGTISINLGGGAPAQRSVTTDAETVYEITLTSADEGSNKTETWPLIGSSTTVITVSPGSWNISIAAYRNEQDKQDEKPFAEGKTVQPVTVIAGENSDATITLKLKDGIINVVVSGNNEQVEYTIILSSGKTTRTQEISGGNNRAEFKDLQPGLWNIGVYADSDDKSYFGDGTVLVEAGDILEETITIRAIAAKVDTEGEVGWKALQDVLQRQGTGDAESIMITSEQLIMNDYIEIGHGRNITLLAKNDLKIIKDGVAQYSLFRVPPGSSLTLGAAGGMLGSITIDGTGGSATDNSSLINVGTNRTRSFNQSNEGASILTIYDNVTLTNNKVIGSSNNNRGGAVVVDGGTFNMYGGTISRNSAPYGGGVLILSGVFNQTGGTIYGSEDEKNGNKATASGATGHVAAVGSFTGTNYLQTFVTAKSRSQTSNGGLYYDSKTSTGWY